jgi:hypothetical protein
MLGHSGVLQDQLFPVFSSSFADQRLKMLLAAAWWQDGFTGLHHGVQNGKLEVVQLLLEHKANVNLANKVVGRNTFPEYFYV